LNKITDSVPVLTEFPVDINVRKDRKEENGEAQKERRTEV
jgi:hypothetical protein